VHVLISGEPSKNNNLSISETSKHGFLLFENKQGRFWFLQCCDRKVITALSRALISAAAFVCILFFCYFFVIVFVHHCAVEVLKWNQTQRAVPVKIYNSFPWNVYARFESNKKKKIIIIIINTIKLWIFRIRHVGQIRKLLTKPAHKLKVRTKGPIINCANKFRLYLIFKITIFFSKVGMWTKAEQ